MDVSTTTIAASAFSACFAGLFAALLQRFWLRAKPRANAVAIIFEGDLVEIDDSLIDASSSLNWGESLSRFVQHNDLIAYELELNSIQQRLHLANKSVDRWLLEIQDYNDDEYLPKSKLLSCPYLNESEIHSYIYGNLRRRTQLDIPTRSFDETPVHFEADENPKGILLHLGIKGVLFPTKHLSSEKQINDNKLIASSFQVGSVRNIRWLLRKFKSDTSEDIVSINEARQLMQSHIIESAKINISVQVSNEGGEPVTFLPYGLLELKCGEKLFKNIVRHHADNDTSPIHDPPMEKSNKSKSKRVHTTPFLNSKSAHPNIVLSKHENREVIFSSEKNKKEENIETIKCYKMGMLSARLTLLRLNGKKIQTEWVVFGESLKADLRDQLMR